MAFRKGELFSFLYALCDTLKLKASNKYFGESI